MGPWGRGFESLLPDRFLSGTEKSPLVKGGPFRTWEMESDILTARGGRMKYLGHILCPIDGYTYITDPKQVLIYYSPDSATFLTEVLCNQCSNIVEGNIDREFLAIFKGHGVKVVPYGNKFAVLTDEMISGWDIEEDLKSLNGVYENR